MAEKKQLLPVWCKPMGDTRDDGCLPWACTLSLMGCGVRAGGKSLPWTNHALLDCGVRAEGCA